MAAGVCRRAHELFGIDFIIRYGLAIGQPAGHGVFVMSIPAPAAGLLALAGLVAARRRRTA